MAIQRIYEERCVGCRICVDSCMNDVIRMRKGKAYIAYPEDCTTCFSCEHDCPRYAIWIVAPRVKDIKESRK